ARGGHELHLHRRPRTRLDPLGGQRRGRQCARHRLRHPLQRGRLEDMRGQDLTGAAVEHHRPVGAHGQGGMLELIGDLPDPARRTPGAQHESGPVLHGPGHGGTVARAHPHRVIDQRAVDVARDEHRAFHQTSGPFLFLRAFLRARARRSFTARRRSRTDRFPAGADAPASAPAVFSPSTALSPAPVPAAPPAADPARRAARSAASASSSSVASANVGAPPPSDAGTQYAPGGYGPSARSESARRRSRISDIDAFTRAVSSSGVPSAAIGAPVWMRIGRPVRPRCLGCPFVHTRCEPQITTGTMGTPASSAIRAAPVLNSLSSKLRLMVASGNTPTSSPARRYPTASAYEPPPLARSTGMCFIPPIT